MTRANYILLDSAKMQGELAAARELNPEHICLYEGDSKQYLGAVAPWLFSFEPNSAFAQWLAEHGPRNNWGIFFRSDEDPDKLYRHLRKFLIVLDEDGRELYFRFYDPRVLRVFLPTCDRDQLLAFFGPIATFIAEDENGLLVEYSPGDDELMSSRLEKDLKGLTPPSAHNTVRRADDVISEGQSDMTKIGEQPEQFPDGPGAEEAGTKQMPSGEKGQGWDFGY